MALRCGGGWDAPPRIERAILPATPGGQASTGAERRALVEHHAPALVGLESPDGIESAGWLAGGAPNRPTRKRQAAGIEYLDEIRRPRKWRGWAVEERLPRSDDRGSATKDAAIAFAAEKYGFFRNVARKRSEIAPRHRVCKLAFCLRHHFLRGPPSRRRLGVDANHALQRSGNGANHECPSVHLTWGSAPHPGSVARGDPGHPAPLPRRRAVRALTASRSTASRGAPPHTPARSTAAPPMRH